jgi:hypothetical protein
MVAEVQTLEPPLLAQENYHHAASPVQALQTTSLSTGGHKEKSSISWLNNSALVYEPECGGMGDGVSSNGVQLFTRSLNKLWRSSPLFNLRSQLSTVNFPKSKENLKRTTRTSKPEIYSLFSFLWAIFVLQCSGSASGSVWFWASRIRIRIG